MAINEAVVGLGKMDAPHLIIANPIQHFNVTPTCNTSSLFNGNVEKYIRLECIKDFGDAYVRDGGTRENNFASSAEINATIEIHFAAENADSFGVAATLPRKAGLFPRMSER